MKKRLFTFFFLLTIIHGQAQLISTKPVEIPVGPVNFNPDVVKQNKIKSIVLDMVDKPDGSIIIDRDATQGFEFDTNGKVVRYYYTLLARTETQEVDVPAVKKHGRIIRPASTRTILKYVNDTVFANVFYDDESRVITKRTRIGDYYDAYYYEYNEKGKIKKETHCRETNISENKNEFRLGVQTVLSSETFEYEQLTPVQIKKKCINDEGREYKKAIISYDTKGNKLYENYDFIVSWMHEESDYEYNEQNYLVKKIYINNQSGEVRLESIYEYDANGSLTSEKKMKGTEVLNEVSYLFDDATKLVKSQIDRDFKNASIGIVKYAYTYY